MTEQSENFQQGLGLLNFEVYEQAIDLFQRDLKENPLNLASFHNIGLAQVYLGITKKDTQLLEAAINNLGKAVAIAKELNYSNGYPSAEINLNWARKELSKLK